jgi:prolipoprotein diacylglyceryltransferase
VIWSLRKKFKVPGTIFGFYLMLNGLERFFIEKIRVNTTTEIFGLKITQAEIISSFLFISGLVIWVVLTSRARKKAAPAGDIQS